MVEKSKEIIWEQDKNFAFITDRAIANSDQNLNLKSTDENARDQSAFESLYS